MPEQNRSLVESVLEAQKERQQLVPVEPTAALAVPKNMEPDFTEEQGILATWKANRMKRRSALDILEQQYKARLELVKHDVMNQVKVGKTQISIRAEELLKELDAKHLAIVSQLDMRNVSIRLKMMQDATDMVVSQLADVEKKDWPVQLKEEVIAKAFELRQKFIERIMKEDFAQTEVDE
jgi:hypothetical protein